MVLAGVVGVLCTALDMHIDLVVREGLGCLKSTDLLTGPAHRVSSAGHDVFRLAHALLLKHWAADVVTPMSLPLPDWTYLYEMPHRDVRVFAHQVYSELTRGEGLNMRPRNDDTFAGDPRNRHHHSNPHPPQGTPPDRQGDPRRRHPAPTDRDAAGRLRSRLRAQKYLSRSRR